MSALSLADVACGLADCLRPAVIALNEAPGFHVKSLDVRSSTIAWMSNRQLRQYEALTGGAP